MDWNPLWISLQTAGLATGIVFFLGLYAARAVLRLRGSRGLRGLLDGVFTLPMVLPPTVVGFFLLLLLGKNGPLGGLLARLGISVVFSWGAAVVAAAVAAFPLMYRTSLGAFEQLDSNLVNAARTLGMGEEEIFWRIVIPNCRGGVVAALVLSFARALGEFGATMMLAGNIPGRTQTLSTAVYTAVQAGNYPLAFRWAGVILAISFASILLMNLCGGGRAAADEQEVL